MIYVVIGPTGVGKTKFSEMLAKEKNAIIINADSMQVYKGLNIGTAKIKENEKENVPHFLFDIKNINEEYNAYLYQKDGRKLLDKYKNENIVIVGGTGLYIKALLYDYNFNLKTSSAKKLYNFKIIGLTKDRESLYKDINKRVDLMIKEGLLEEAYKVYKTKDKNHSVKTSIGYKELFPYFENKISLEEAIENIKKNSRHYAKRQYTFFKNQFENVYWINIEEVPFSKLIKDL
ncbi:MAG: tRNA (adenosine(37)-N6)-dimethylallyltransferase MiaA [bacterium]|nr:tRNA (adenosine(37)-N6)-dimethylallyltransferase MiaA [bacterium]